MLCNGNSRNDSTLAVVSKHLPDHFIQTVYLPAKSLLFGFHSGPLLLQVDHVLGT
eukprot:m.25851 g.25851  ORF g.25851 m.25851 type:complete len:55 (+) comp28989_c0_seq1:1346-1510(+)